MLKAFRDNLKYLGWVLWLVIIAFILVAFVGLGDLGPGGAATDVAATVGDRTVSYREFESAYRRTEDFYRQAYGQQFNADLARQLGLHRQVLDTLVADRILLLEADRLGVEVTDSELQSEILQLPVFVDEDGSFVGSKDYARILRQNGLTQAGFEASMRQDMLLSKVRNLLTRNVYVADGEVERTYRERTERATIRYFQAPYAALAGDVTFDAAELEAFYADNEESFQTPERRVVEYLVVDVERLRNGLVMSPEEVRAYYDDNPDEFDRPEQVRARHILLQVNATRSAEEARSLLEDAKRRIESGEDFAQLAGQLSEDPGSKTNGGDLGFFGRGAMVEAFENAAFATPVGQMTGPVQTDFGFHLIQVLERNEGGVSPFEEVQASISERLLLERSNEAAEEKAEELAERLASSDTELAAAAEADETVTFQDTPAFSADENVPGVGRSTPFARTAFELEVGEISDPVRVPRGWAVLDLTEIQAPRIPALGEVRAQAEERLRTEKVRAAALERLDVGRDKGLDQLAEALDVTVEESESFGADGPGGELGENPEIALAALGADEGTLLGPVATDGGAVMFEVVERVKFDPAVFARERAATRESLVAERGGRLVGALIAERREQLDVTFDSQLLANFELEASGAASG